jgi:MinD-like ATPase involved in chromosome partitioning or flagellar assembly/tetratricopeptide (TPR) repeat protein
MIENTQLKENLGKNGKVITFYSYKGGTGRSLLVANAAMVLASNNCRVLVVDWDLEAPGLHHYFKPFLTDPMLKSSLGLVDMLTDYWDSLAVDTRDARVNIQQEREKWIATHLDLYQYAVTLNLPRKEGVGDIVFVPAGRQTPAYASKVGNFDWDAFYSEAGGKGLLDAFKEKVITEFDYVLIDSRTGVSDTSGICTVHLPDELVLCFTYNNQNVIGARGIANTVLKTRNLVARNNNAIDSQVPLRIFPVPTRVARDNKVLLEERQRFTWGAFADCVSNVNQDPVRDYWLKVEQPYEPDQSYVETFAFLTGVAGDPKGLLSAIEQVCARITNYRVKRWNNFFNSEELYALRNTNIGYQIHPPKEPPSSDEDIAHIRANISVAWKVFCRFLRGDQTKAGSWNFRSVPATLFKADSALIERMIRAGDLIVKERSAGIEQLELSSKTLNAKELLQSFANEQSINLSTLANIESKTSTWLSSQNSDATKIADSNWLNSNRNSILQLRDGGFFQNEELLFLNAASSSIKAQSSSNRSGLVMGGMGALAALLLGLAISQFLQVRAVEDQLKKSEDQTVRQNVKVKKDFDEIGSKYNALLRKVDAYENDRSPLTSYGKGHEAFAREDYQSAVIYFSEAITVNPSGIADAYRARGISYERLITQSYKNDIGNRNALILRENMHADFIKWLETTATPNRRLYAARSFLKVSNYDASIEQLNQLIADSKKSNTGLTPSEFGELQLLLKLLIGKKGITQQQETNYLQALRPTQNSRPTYDAPKTLPATNVPTGTPPL